KKAEDYRQEEEPRRFGPLRAPTRGHRSAEFCSWHSVFQYPGFQNPTDGIGGLFIPCLLSTTRCHLPESHRRSPWIVHTLPTKHDALPPSRIPPTQSVDCSYPAY